MWGFSIHVWEVVWKYSTVTALVFGGLTAAAAFISAWVGYQISDVVQQEANKKIADEQSKIEVTKAEAANAHVVAAEANKAAAEAN